MSARRSKVARLARKSRYRCKQCGSTDVQTKEYSDRTVLYICRQCSFPERVVKA